MFDKFSYFVSHNAGVFLPSYSTTQEFSYVVSHGTEDSIHCGIQQRKIIQRRIMILNFKCLSLPSDENLGKISYLDIQTNPWKKF
jgi:hypothetical protein